MWKLEQCWKTIFALIALPSAVMCDVGRVTKAHLLCAPCGGLGPLLPRNQPEGLIFFLGFIG